MLNSYPSLAETAEVMNSIDYTFFFFQKASTHIKEDEDVSSLKRQHQKSASEMSANASVTQSREQTGGFQNLKEKKTKKQSNQKYFWSCCVWTREQPKEWTYGLLAPSLIPRKTNLHVRSMFEPLEPSPGKRSIVDSCLLK